VFYTAVIADPTVCAVASALLKAGNEVLFEGTNLNWSKPVWRYAATSLTSDQKYLYTVFFGRRPKFSCKERKEVISVRISENMH